MDHARLPQRRTLLIGLAAVGLVPLAGCMTKPVRPANADGTYCFAIGKSYSRKLTCTSWSARSGRGAAVTGWSAANPRNRVLELRICAWSQMLAECA